MFFPAGQEVLMTATYSGPVTFAVNCKTTIALSMMVFFLETVYLFNQRRYGLEKPSIDNLVISYILQNGHLKHDRRVRSSTWEDDKIDFRR
ncbi:hypothetical protein pdam_00011554, partial [Pocillopora damicornis]